MGRKALPIAAAAPLTEAVEQLHRKKKIELKARHVDVVSLGVHAWLKQEPPPLHASDVSHTCARIRGARSRNGTHC